MVEYALILVLVGVVVIVVLAAMGDQVHDVFSNITCALEPTAHRGMGGCATGKPIG
jgi:Flp pilus assembly pilin Flp